MGTRQIRIIIGIYCSHPAKICGFIHYDMLNMTVFVVLRSYVLECLVQLFVSLCLWCLKRALGVVCKCFLVKNVIYVCGSFSCGFFMFVSSHTEVHVHRVTKLYWTGPLQNNWVTLCTWMEQFTVIQSCAWIWGWGWPCFDINVFTSLMKILLDKY